MAVRVVNVRATRDLMNLEERAYTDWYPFRLIRVGGAVFYDGGRAWGGSNPNTANSGLLKVKWDWPRRRFVRPAGSWLKQAVRREHFSRW